MDDHWLRHLHWRLGSSKVSVNFWTDILVLLVVVGLIVTSYFDWRQLYGKDMAIWPNSSLYFHVVLTVIAIVLVIAAFFLYS